MIKNTYGNREVRGELVVQKCRKSEKYRLDLKLLNDCDKLISLNLTYKFVIKRNKEVVLCLVQINIHTYISNVYIYILFICLRLYLMSNRLLG